jgi:hypothetical protein
MKSRLFPALVALGWFAAGLTEARAQQPRAEDPQRLRARLEEKLRRTERDYRRDLTLIRAAQERLETAKAVSKMAKRRLDRCRQQMLARPDGKALPFEDLVNLSLTHDLYFQDAVQLEQAVQLSRAEAETRAIQIDMLRAEIRRLEQRREE